MVNHWCLPWPLWPRCMGRPRWQLQSLSSCRVSVLDLPQACRVAPDQTSIWPTSEAGSPRPSKRRLPGGPRQPLLG